MYVYMYVVPTAQGYVIRDQAAKCVFIHACMGVTKKRPCMYVCMYVCVCLFMHACMSRKRDHVCMYVCLYSCMQCLESILDDCMYVCECVCMYVYNTDAYMALREGHYKNKHVCYACMYECMCMYRVCTQCMHGWVVHVISACTCVRTRWHAL